MTAVDLFARFERMAAELDRLTRELDTAGLVAGRELLATLAAAEPAHPEFLAGRADGATGAPVHAHLSERPDQADRRLYLAGYARGHDGIEATDGPK
ncbi:MAG TPA: hypothetical protein VNY84_10975 [Acidimicrobiales bacterium]|jgi:hypothetical protein|nr:hypothetical protein [Acidimicrobiales bacterium]